MAALLKTPAVAGPVLRSSRARGLNVVVRAEEPRVQPIREYREDGAPPAPSASSAGQQQPGGPVYADEVAKMQRQQRPKDNMSKEMKQRLRKEYMGLGGAENTAALMPHPRRPVIVAATTLEESPAETSPEVVLTQKVRSSKWVIDENEQLNSTWEHRGWTLGSMAVMAGTLLQGLSHVSGVQDLPGVAAALVGAYVLSDLGTGIYHWAVDNYGGPNTPFFGRQIAAFQGHHQRPWTITEREFCNNVHQVFKPFLYPAAFFLAVSPWAAPEFNVFISTFLFLVCMSQQFHAWSHMKKSELPAAIVALQDANVLISRKAHGAHHRAPFEGWYCIVSGWWNPLLDGTQFFRHLERAIHARTGVEPRCWHEPEHGWQELERPAAQN